MYCTFLYINIHNCEPLIETKYYGIQKDSAGARPRPTNMKLFLRQNILKLPFYIINSRLIVINLTVAEEENGSVDEGAEGV